MEQSPNVSEIAGDKPALPIGSPEDLLRLLEALQFDFLLVASLSEVRSQSLSRGTVPVRLLSDSLN
jgi:hypothetical protein